MSEPTLGDLLDRYFDLGVAEGREGRTHDTLDGVAQEIRQKIAGAVARAREEAARDALEGSPCSSSGLPQDVISLVIAAREFWDVNNDLSEESTALDKALEAFADRVPFENQPDEEDVDV